ncbi:Neuromedin-U receptor 2 [Dissostichus eleginoides]|uniref:Neuromedin-U receptor 2 n=1 Tax=Dissostichus eleginoides TaxID=100907 RepID=A0AAD9CKZ0_DISEL|nr:Neuromedin-U receptor 2 [Dissostichus eleginoides]
MEQTLQGCSLNISKLVHNTSVPLNATGNYTSDQVTEVNLVEILGPKRSPFFLPVSSVYLLIFLVGLSGNLLTCAVIAKHKKMRNPTNLYLLSLALSDLLVLLFGMPLEVYDLWQNYPFPFGEGGCYFKTFLFEAVCFASILNVTALSVERYIAVVHPLKTRYLSTNKHAKRVITIVWVVSMICAIPNTSLHGLFYLKGRMEESAICTVLKPLWIYNMVMQITTVCFYFVPMMVISVLYLVMGLHLCRERRQPSENLGRNCSSNIRRKMSVNGRRRQINKMLSIVVAVFGVCWAPFHIERLLWSSISQWTDLMHNIYQYIHILSGVFFYLSSAVNPIIYSLLSTRFRECFRELVCSQTEENSSVRDSPPFPKILLEPSVSSARAQVEDKDSNAFIPLLFPNMKLSMDTTILKDACREKTCKTPLPPSLVSYIFSTSSCLILKCVQTMVTAMGEQLKRSLQAERTSKPSEEKEPACQQHPQKVWVELDQDTLEALKEMPRLVATMKAALDKISGSSSSGSCSSSGDSQQTGRNTGSNDLMFLGNSSVQVSTRLFQRLGNRRMSLFTQELATLIFGNETLAKSTLTGKGKSAETLDPEKVNAIIGTDILY